MQTRTYRDHYKQLNVKTTKTLTLNNKKAELSIHTSKSSNKMLTTTASIGWPSEDGRSITHKVFEDFYTTQAKSNPARITQAVAEAQHNQVLQNLSSIESQVQEHYKAS
jgi:hypothetical protein